MTRISDRAGEEVMRRIQVRSRRLMLASSAGALLLLSHAALAADAADAAAASSNSATSAQVLEEVVVTAEKRAENIQLVPASISAVSGAKLTTLGLKDLRDYSQYVPGLIINSLGSPGQTTVTLRGIASLGPGSVVGYYLDDTPLGSSNNYARATAFPLDLLPYDIQQLEVLRGPQGTLYGAGAMGGLLKYDLIQADPTRFSARVGGELGYIDHSDGAGYGLRAAVNIPLVADTLAIRVSGFDQKAQGYINNSRLSVSGVNDVEQYGGRAAATWTPTTNLRINLNAISYRLKSDDDAIVRLGNVVQHTDPGGAVYDTGTPVNGPFGQSYAFRNPFTKNIDYYSAAINWDLDRVTAISATSFSHTRTHQVTDATDSYGAFTEAFGLPPGVGKFDLDLSLDKFTQEFRLQSQTGARFEWLAGAFYTHEKSANHQLATVFDANYQPITGPFAPIFNPFFAFVELPSTYKEYAAFGNLTVNFTDQFDLTGGVRYAHNSQQFEQISDGLILGGFTDNPGSSSEGVTTWSVSSRYRFTPDVMIYGKIATGYRPGGPNVQIPGLSDIPPTVNSDRLTSYEVGLKGTFLDGRALLDVSAFDIQWKGIQLSVATPDQTATFLSNAGDAYSRGFEAEGSYSPVEGLRLGFNAAYTKAQLTSVLPNAPVFIIGYQLPGVPTFAGAVTADYSWYVMSGWQATVGGGIHYIGSQWNFSPVVPGKFGFAPGSRNPAYTQGDLHAGLSNDRWAVNLFVRNVTDKRVYLQGSPVTSPIFGNTYAFDAVLLQPRTVGISVDARF